MNTRSTRLTLLGLAFGVLLALLIAPQTRWLVRLQTLTALRLYHPLTCTSLPCSYTTSVENDKHLNAIVAARHSNDFLMQYGNAVTAVSQDLATLNLRALTSRFQNNPILYANLLRYEGRDIQLDRSDQYRLFDEPVPSYVYNSAPPTPAILAVYDQDAALGEQTDPQNAYFSLMRAYGLFAAHRDAEALAAVQRASVKPVWREYFIEDNEAQWRLHTEAFRDPGALAQASIAASQLFWQYGRLRKVADLVVYQAVLIEQAGHPKEGLALREAVRRCGDLMRVQSTALIGSLVGIAISAVSQTRPGGGPYQNYDGLLPEQMAQQRLEAYCTYVINIGHPEAAQRAREEEAAQRSVQAFMKDPDFADLSVPLRRLADWWLADVALLMNIGWLLGFGLVAAGLNRLSQRRQAAEKPPQDWKATGSQIALALGLWLLVASFALLVTNFWSFSISDPKELVWRVALGLLGAFGLVFWWVRRALRRMPSPQRWAVLRTAAFLPLLVGILYGLNYWVTQQQGNPLVGIAESLHTLIEYSGNDSTSDAEQAWQTRTFQLSVAASLAVPILLLLGFSFTALLRRTSFSRTLITGFQTIAFPTICLLLIVYGGLLLGTARQERLVSGFNHQMVYEGGRYFAAQAGEAWPGPVR